MNRARLFQIIICFAAVFVLGGVCGWLLKPMPPAWAGEPSSNRVLSNLDLCLQLTVEQKQKLAPVLAEWERSLPPVGQNPRRRYELFTNYAPRVRTVLTTNQLAAYDKMVEENQKKAARRRH